MHAILDKTSPPRSDFAVQDGIRLVSVFAGRWRALDAGGRAIGHLESLQTADGTRFRARRFHAPSRTFRDLGDFWSSADALECLRYSR